MMDLLAAIKAKHASYDLDDDDIDWLIGQAEQVERLRGLLKRLEWASDEQRGRWKTCPACHAVEGLGYHNPDCWLAEEIAND